MSTYDPRKKYSWGADSKFELNGSEFGLVLNTIRAILNTEEAAKILLADRANDALEGIMAKAVESGVLKEEVSNKEN